ncbi:MAG: hypothetical protein DRP42_01610 [Tenericutes bacterium]|nr:MAG: hypothetical protein DRP42_01610 [Mycoplasmatota bacterium]
MSEDISSETNELTQKEAKELGATFLEGTKYSDIVRVVKFGDVAIDLCGGTHSKSSSTLGQILITKLESKGSGTYRLEAVTTKDSIDKFVKNNIELKVEELKSKITNISSTIDSKDIEATTKTIVAKVNDLRNESPLSLTEKLDSY